MIDLDEFAFYLMEQQQLEHMEILEELDKGKSSDYYLDYEVLWVEED